MQIPPFKLERYFARYEFNVDYVLCASDCESLTIQDLLALEPHTAERFQQHWLGYTESMGNPSLRTEICGLYRDVRPNQVLVHTGAEEAIFLFMHAVLNAKDHVIVHWPCHQSLAEVALNIGCRFPRLIGEEFNDFCKNLVEHSGVLLLPGTLYDDPGNHFRIGFGRKNFPDALTRLEDFLGRS